MGKEREILKSTPYVYKGDDVFALFVMKKYTKIREGVIEPIPITKTKGFDVWGGYQETRFFISGNIRRKREKKICLFLNKKRTGA